MQHFVPLDIAAKLALSLGVGLLAGFEREWSHKDLGVRTFAATALLGMLSALVSVPFAIGALFVVGIVIALVNSRALLLRQNLEITTSVSLVVNFVLGVLIGQGHFFTPVAAALLLTLLLSLKPEFTSFAGGLRPEEIRSAVVLGLIGFVIYPLLPNRSIDPWNLINLRETWIIVIVIAAIGFTSYVLLRAYGDRGLLYTAILGGLVNSTATIAELATWLREPSPESYRAGMFFNFVTVAAMFLRNLAILAIFAHQAVVVAFVPMLLMSALSLLFVWFSKGFFHPARELKLSSPVAVGKLISFGVLLLLIEIAGAAGKRYLGGSGVILVSLAGGLVSSASTTAAAAILAAHGETIFYIAGLATIVTSIASALSNLPVIYRVTRNGAMTRGLAVKSLAVSIVGIAALAVEYGLGLRI
ncbi:MAG TPA: DUF4010 domain-containing protein [Bryobacteraceae bacterium]|nr:DUF4010 domain-containing protein [Bryobacteraceae bacterium]